MVRCDIYGNNLSGMQTFYNISISKANSSMSLEDIQEVCSSCFASINQHIRDLKIIYAEVGGREIGCESRDVPVR